MTEFNDLLTLVAEISAAFVGFSMVIGLLRPEAPGAIVRLSMMRAVAELALIAGAGALLVLLLPTFGVSAAWTWRGGSAAMLACWVALHSSAMRRLRKGGHPWMRSEPIRVAAIIAIVGMVVLLYNCLFPGAYSGALYCAALGIALADSAFIFVRAAFFTETSDSGAGGRAVERESAVELK